MTATDQPPEGFVRGNARLRRLLANPLISDELMALRSEMDAADRAYAMNLAAVRKASELTQVELAHRLRTTQGQVSRLENQNDALLSTLLAYLEAAGVTDAALTGTVAGRRVCIELGAAARSAS
ncbi:MAG: helix-turn-helix transcriptional regulator [Micrococcales bacterium]|nr:helix-turn-helix transcriptional regulator [Micrococcales bacterium]